MPVGSYTVQVLNQMGLNSPIRRTWSARRPRTRTCVAKVALGQADAGFVYLYRRPIVPGDLTLITVPAWAQPKITYSMAVVTKSPNQAAAQAFVNKVMSPAGQADVRQVRLPAARPRPVPTIAKVAPGKAKPGATLTVTGTNFKGTTSVTFQGVPAKFKVVLAVEADVTVPAEGEDRSLTVTNPIGTATWKIDHDRLLSQGGARHPPSARGVERLRFAAASPLGLRPRRASRR